MLNPLFKWQWFDAHWTTPNLAPALIQGRASVQQLWQSNYAEAYTNRPITPQHNGVGGEDGEVNDFAAFLFWTTAATAARVQVFDEYAIYVAEPPLVLLTCKETNDFRALAWWTERTQRDRYLKLSKMAFDLLTMPVMSAEIERVFSECSLMLNTQRLSMSQETLEQLMCLKTWRR